MTVRQEVYPDRELADAVAQLSMERDCSISEVYKEAVRRELQREDIDA